MAYRVALLGIYHESNTFINSPTTLDDFRRGHWLVGEAIRKEYQHAHHEIGGMLEVMDRYAIEVVPVLFAEATPGGIVSKDAYFTLTAQMFDGLRDVLPVDGCLVVPHGAGVSEDYPDMDGDWLSKLREIIGPNVPIMGTLDLHANVSKQMIAATDALIAYRQNPHIDQRERGTEAARLMVDCLNGSVRPVQRLVQPPIAISIEQQLTTAEPCKSFYRELAKKDTEKGILAVNVALGFPYADVEEMGTSIWVVADGVVELAIDTANELKSYLLTNRRRFVGKRTNIDVALAEAAVSPKPVLLLDMGDNIGGGGPGNGLSLLAALEDKGILRYCLCIWDPEAVAQVSGLRSAGPFKLTINGDEQNGLEKRQIDVKTVEMVDGKFKEHAPRHGGQVTFDMGETAIVTLVNGSVVMVTSYRVPPFSLRQLTAFGIDPSVFDVLVAKGVHAPLAAYGPVCSAVIQVDTPGVTQADMTRFTYRHRRKPLFPFEQIDDGD